ncbi:hypothetical protein REPUB_Repub08aG0239400 [Reevesia pubescens]
MDRKQPNFVTMDVIQCFMDDKVVAFQDIKPAAFRHYLVISVEHIPTRSSKKKEETQRCTSVKSMQLFCTSLTYHGSIGNHHRGRDWQMEELDSAILGLFWYANTGSDMQPKGSEFFYWKNFRVSVKCKRNFKAVKIDTRQPPYVFKCLLYYLTGVPPERQKIMVKGGLLKDYADWSSIGVKQALPQRSVDNHLCNENSARSANLEVVGRRICIILWSIKCIYQVEIPFLCHGYGYTEDCLTLIYDLLSPVKGNSKHKLSHQKPLYILGH